MGIHMAPAVLPATGRPRGSVIVGLTTSMGTGSSKPPWLAANANASELCLDIPLLAERILILNYHLIHQGWLLARKPQLQSALFMQSAAEPRNLPEKRRLRWVQGARWMALMARGDAKPPGMLPLKEQMRLCRKFHPPQSTQLGTCTGQPHRR